MERTQVWGKALERIESRDALVAVVGLGYVGLPVAVAFAETGFKVLGVDLDRERVRAVEEGRSHILHVPDERVAALRRGSRLRATTSYRRLQRADAILICVPTPVTDGTPDLSLVIAAGKAIGKVLTPGTVVVLESTTYPGTTEELLRPLLEAGGLTAGEDFFLAFSPERIDPGNPIFGFSDIPKIVGGIDDTSTNVAASLYGQVVPKVVKVSSPREAELAKLIENTYRHVNIALVNELAIYAHEMGIDIWEAIEAAASKPFGYQPFWPGPGWGGHCVPLDPTYLSWRVRRDRSHEVRFVELAQAVNSEMPRHVVERIAGLLSDEGKPVKGAGILAVGVAYKGDIDDTREAGALKVISRLASRGANVDYHDPLVREVEVGGQTLRSVPVTADTVGGYDLVVVFTCQSGVDWKLIESEARLIFDCCNAFGTKSEKVVRL